MRRKLTLAASVLASGLVLMGCGGSSSSTPTSGGGSGGSTPTPAASAGIAAARKIVAKYETLRSNTPLPKLSKRPPKGYTLDVLTCPLPACQQTTSGAVQGAKDLGWHVKLVTYPLTPNGYVAAFNNVAQNPPDGLAFISVFPLSTIHSQLVTAHNKGTKIAVITPPAPLQPNGLVSAVLQGAPEFSEGGVLAADAVAADAGGTTDAAVVSDPSYTLFKPAIAGFKSTMAKRCPSCSVAKINISLSNPAAQTDQTVTSYLRQNPSTKYLLFTEADSVLGLPAALASAGITGVKIISMTPNLTTLSDIKSGSEWAAIQIENGTTGYRAVDALARLSVGDSTGVERDPAGYARILNASNVVSGRLPTAPGTPDAFLKAWGVSGS